MREVTVAIQSRSANQQAVAADQLFGKGTINAIRSLEIPT